MQFKHVTLDFDGSVAVLTLDHQEVMNAVSVDMLGGLAEALDAIEDRRDEVRCLVITGAGRAFCTGAKLQGRNNTKPGSRKNAGAALTDDDAKKPGAAANNREAPEPKPPLSKGAATKKPKPN